MTYSKIDVLRTQIDLLVEEQLKKESSLSENDFVLKLRDYEDQFSLLEVV